VTVEGSGGQKVAVIQAMFRVVREIDTIHRKS
jgi:hypothetical protein